MTALALRSKQRGNSGLLAACAANGYRVAIREARDAPAGPGFRLYAPPAVRGERLQG